MKLVQVDGMNNETVPDVLIIANLNERQGKILLEAYIEAFGCDRVWYRLFENDQRLCRGMEDLI